MAASEKSLVIGIAGGSGSGKTLFVQQLLERIPARQVSLISLDNYYLPETAQQIDPEGVVNFDLPSAIAREDLIRDLRLLLEGETLQRPEYVFNNSRAQPRTLTLWPAPILLVEGLFVFHYPELREMLDLRIFVHAKENLKVIRRIKRDRIERNYPLEDVLYRYENHVLPTFERYVKPYMEESDLVINNNRSFEWGLQVIAGYIRDYLRS